MSDAHPHRRRNPLTGRHVLVSPQRVLRPWQGVDDGRAPPRGPAHDPDCYLCPGNTRATGAVNPVYRGTYAFDNDYPALLDQPASGVDDPLFGRDAVTGAARVLCFSPDHGATLARLDNPAIERVVDAWCDEAAMLGRRFASVQVFENKGEMMGCSNPHPHGQIWASDFIPDEVAIEDAQQRTWFDAHGRPLLLEVIEREADGERQIEANEHWLAFVPFWATWPFETLLAPRAPVVRLPELDAPQRAALADIIGRLTRRYDALFGAPFPYSMGWHGAPFDDAEAPHWRLHAHFYPPLLRSASVRKFMVGYEMLAEAQRDLTPEQAAQMLRDAPP
ncbi:MAG: UDP-glucose--hexose-1-phosphate uridylyltransferase [Proteobacteria bacterium]|nr:UDP-glucose--hexose-1-phosphate uridylyltransferase [Pseudomonadota bacterium]